MEVTNIFYIYTYTYIQISYDEVPSFADLTNVRQGPFQKKYRSDNEGKEGV